MGSIRKSPRTVSRRKDEVRWEARYRDPAGRQHTRTFGSQAEAKAFLNAIETDIIRGDYIDPAGGKVTFGAWAEEYLAGAVHKRATTLSRDRSVLEAHWLPILGARPLGTLTPLDIRRAVEAISAGRAPATVRMSYAVFHAVIAAAVDAELIARTPCRGIAMPSPSRKKEIRFLTPEELERLANAMPAEFRAMIYLTGVLGLRWSEVAGLKVGRLDLLRRKLTVAETLSAVRGHLQFADVKTKAARRTLDIPTFLAEILAEHLASRGVDGRDPDALVFVSALGGPLYASNFAKWVWAKAVRAAGLDGQGLTFHHLRHTAVGFLIAVNAPPRVIQRRMGHSSIRVTFDVYGSVLPEVEESVTERLAGLFANSRGADVVQGRGGAAVQASTDPSDQHFRSVGRRDPSPQA
jgi:integrase